MKPLSEPFSTVFYYFGTDRQMLLICLYCAEQLSYLLTYLLTQWSTVLLEKLTGFQLVKKFPACYGIRRFITAFTSAPNCLILKQLGPVHTPTSHYLKIQLNIIFASTPSSPKWSLSLRFPNQNPLYASPLPIRATCPAHLILLEFITRSILGE